MLILILLILCIIWFVRSLSASKPGKRKPTGPHYTEPQREGTVYVIRNPLFPQYVKIGMTTRDTLKRVNEFNGSVPIDYDIMIDLKCIDPYGAEQLIHKHFDKCRVTPRKEFFLIELDDLKKELTKLKIQKL